jgi:type IV pilus assembly protein PilC
MPFFRYAATDPQGKAVQGTVRARTPEEAASALEQKGFRVTAFLDPSAKHAIPAAVQPQIRTPAPVQRSQVVLEVPSAPLVHGAGPGRKPLAPKKTRRGTDKERFFLFTQIANFMRAGVNPYQAFADMASRIQKEDFREAMNAVAQYAAEGLPISDVLASYPDLFPTHVVGLVRAGEAGGFLPEACTAVAQQAEAAHKFRRSLWMLWVVGINLFLVAPVAYLFYRGVPRAYELTEQSGATGISGGLSAFSAAFWELIKWPIGPAALLIYALTVAAYLWVNSRAMTAKRHGWSLATPVLGGRAKHEGLSLFTYVLSKVAQAGVPPYRSWEIGMECVPNAALREKLRAAGSSLHSGERLSKAFFESRLFPQEYAPMMATAEMTGDVPGTLQKLSDMGRHEFDLSTTKSKAAAWVMTSTAVIVTMGMVVIFLALTLYVKLPETVLKGMEP